MTMDGDRGNVLIVGCGAMARAHAAVLNDLGVSSVAVGRSAENAAKFQADTRIRSVAGGIAGWLSANPIRPDRAIVAVGVADLEPLAAALMTAGLRRLLIEKPGALTFEGVRRLSEQARDTGTEVFIAYNRRFTAATLAAAELIHEDGGATSCRFEFTEWIQRVEAVGHNQDVLRNWFFANPTHVIDLAFHLVGTPERMQCFADGELPWHERSRYSGAGISLRGTLLSYHADWTSAGRWGIEVMTTRRRLHLSPLESLSVQNRGSIVQAPQTLDLSLDERFKPGLYRQMEAFLESGKPPGLLSIEGHMDNIRWYRAMNEGLHAP